MFKVNNKDTKRYRWPCSSVSIVNFEQFLLNEKLIDFFHGSFGTLKYFMKVLMAFLKPHERTH